MPKPPPTFSAITRNCVSASLNTSVAMARRIMCGPCTVQRSVVRRSRKAYSAMQPRGSMELVVSRLITMRCLMTCAAAANIFATAAASPAVWVKAWLSGTAFPHRDGARQDRLLGGSDGGQRVVFDLDRLGGVLGLLQRFGDDEGDGIAEIAHPVAGEKRLRRGKGRAAVAPLARRHRALGAELAQRLVLAGQHQEDAGHRLGGVGRDGDDAGMAMGRTQHIAARLPARPARRRHSARRRGRDRGPPPAGPAGRCRTHPCLLALHFRYPPRYDRNIRRCSHLFPTLIRFLDVRSS